MSDFMKNWDQERLIQWIESIKENPKGITTKSKKIIIAGIHKRAEENEEEVTGDDFYEAEKEELIELCNIKGAIANRLLKEIAKRKDDEFDISLPVVQPPSSSSLPFTLNIQGKQAQNQTLKQCYSTDTIFNIKMKYLADYSPDITSNKNAYKWDSEKGKISFTYNGQQMVDGKTLSDYNITTTNMLPILCVFRVKGGADDDVKYESDDEDLTRRRKLRHKRYKSEIILSNDPDCIMGYNNSDGIKRAKMPCGCSFSSDTMFRLLKAEFSKNLKQIKIGCPQPLNKCKGTQKQRAWDWSIIFIVADLSKKEISRYTKAINLRNTGSSKRCPHPNCGVMNERPLDLRRWRVRCDQCSNSDWCWECGKLWKSGGITVCGNDNCMGKKLNYSLSKKGCGSIKASSGWAKGCEVPTLRACPKCLTLIEYTQACKHMTCLGCPHEFCFKCLKDWETVCSNKESSCLNHCSNGKACDKHGHQTFK